MAAREGVVEEYLSAIAEHDWPSVASCVAAGVERIGPYGERCTGREDYVALLSEVVPALRRYKMDVQRVLYTADRRQAVAELSETVEVDGELLLTPEALVFDMDDDGLISRVAIYLSRSRA